MANMFTRLLAYNREVTCFFCLGDTKPIEPIIMAVAYRVAFVMFHYSTFHLSPSQQLSDKFVFVLRASWEKSM